MRIIGLVSIWWLPSNKANPIGPRTHYRDNITGPHRPREETDFVGRRQNVRRHHHLLIGDAVGYSMG